VGIHSLREGASRSAAAVRTAEYGGNGLAWLRDRDALNVILDGSHTALVDPPLLCRIILESCISCGLRLHQPVRPISFARSSSGATSSVEIIYTSTQDTKTLSCTNFVFAAVLGCQRFIVFCFQDRTSRRSSQQSQVTVSWSKVPFTAAKARRDVGQQLASPTGPPRQFQEGNRSRLHPRNLLSHA